MQVREKIKATWQALTIKKKIAAFTGMVFLIISLSVMFDIWVVEFSLIDFNGILQDNAKSSELVQALESEQELFENYMKSNSEEERIALGAAMQRTYDAVYNLPFSYNEIGEVRYAKTWSIRNSYEVYRQRRDAVLLLDESEPDYIGKLYEVYGMQRYLQEYANTLMTYTIEAGNSVYQERVPTLIRVPIAVILFGIILFWGMLKLAKLMNSTIISPVMELVAASQKIATNDFFVEDVKVENKDELGELVRAFNKMKYATGEYILALEEKRKTLDLLHEEELEKLETEKRLEMIKLELLKSQINPHFLFNTLNVIGGMANLEDAHTTEKMIKALSSLFRYNLKTPEVEIALVRELKVVENYMYLQQMRFGERISYEVNSEVNEELVVVPTFTFQPLVENAIIHGLSPKEAGGRIRIHIWKREQRLFITIGDDGIGMDEGQLTHLREQLRQGEEGHTGIGLGNIYRRIHAMYEDSSVQIYSKKNAGTVIRIEIPQN
ncbi:MAG: histidine kinase [Clostridiales bacterium]|nr:histidine kinase [Roseburia sp.]MDD7635767.1 histidine kinase [Clostridiales bacterium]MDY4112294.1 histidine kinase [Roseburia sp.]